MRSEMKGIQICLELRLLDDHFDLVVLKRNVLVWFPAYLDHKIVKGNECTLLIEI